MAKFHITAKGEPALCRATLKGCPLGGDAPHAEFENEKEARAWVEALNEASQGGSFTKKPSLDKYFFETNVVSVNDADMEALLAEKAARASKPNEIANLEKEATELIRLDTPEARMTFVVMVNNVKNQEAYDALVTAYDRALGWAHYIPEEHQTMTIKLGTHRFTDTKAMFTLFNKASPQLAMEDRIRFAENINTAEAYSELLRTTGWQEGDDKYAPAIVDKAKELLADAKPATVSYYVAGRLIRFSENLKKPLDPNALVSATNFNGMENYKTEFYDYAHDNLKALTPENRLRVINATKSQVELGVNYTAERMLRSFEKPEDKLNPRVYSSHDKAEAEKNYRSKLELAGGAIRANYVSDENSAARQALIDWDKTRIAELHQEYTETLRKSKRTFGNRKEKAAALEEAKVLARRFNDAQEERRWDMIRDFVTTAD